MARKGLAPKLRHHKPSGQAMVRLGGRDHYLGKFGSPNVQERYDALIAEWLLSGRGRPGPGSAPGGPDLTISELILAWLRHADEYYVRDGSPTKEPAALRLACRPLRQLYAHSPAREFSPLKLKAVRQAMIDADLCRAEVNRRVGRILRMFRWAVSEELILEAVYSALKSVEGLRRGRSKARETAPVMPVEWRHVEATIPLLAPRVGAIVSLLRLTGARVGEIVILRTEDLDMAGEVWQYRPARHKGEHRGRERIIYLGPRAQEVLRPWLKHGRPGEYVFSPREAMEARWAEQRARRKTKVQPSQANRKREAKMRSLGEFYPPHAVHHAIRQAIKRRNEEINAKGLAVPELPRWHPHQIRHAVATELAARHGHEGARVILGHADLDATRIYAEKDQQAAMRIMREVG